MGTSLNPSVGPSSVEFSNSNLEDEEKELEAPCGTEKSKVEFEEGKVRRVKFEFKKRIVD